MTKFDELIEVITDTSMSLEITSWTTDGKTRLRIRVSDGGSLFCTEVAEDLEAAAETEAMRNGTRDQHLQQDRKGK